MTSYQVLEQAEQFCGLRSNVHLFSLSFEKTTHKNSFSTDGCKLRQNYLIWINNIHAEHVAF